MTIVTKQSKKYLFLSFFIFSIGSNLTQNENDSKQTVTETKNNISSNDAAYLFTFFEKTITFLQKKKCDPSIISSFFGDFIKKNPTFNLTLQHFLSQDSDQKNLSSEDFAFIATFLSQLIAHINKENNLGLHVQEIDFLAAQKESNLLLSRFYDFVHLLPEINNTEPSEMETGEKISDVSIQLDEHFLISLNDLTSRIATLLKKIIDNLTQKNYNKSLIKKMTKQYIKEETIIIAFKAEYTELIKQFIEECLHAIQENIFLINTLQNEFYSLTQEKQYEHVSNILEKNLFALSFIKYQVDKKFLPSDQDQETFLKLERKLKKLKHNKENTEKIKAIQKEQKNLFLKMQEKIISGIRKKSLEIKNKIDKKNHSIDEKVASLITITKELTESEQALCYYKIQNIYRSMYWGTQHFLEKNIFTKGLKEIVNNPAKLLSAYFAYDMYKYLHPFKNPENAYVSMLVGRIMETYREFHASGTGIESTYAMDESKFLAIHDEMIYGSAFTERERLEKIQANIDSMTKSISEEQNDRKKSYYEQEKATLHKEKESLRKKLENNALAHNFCLENNEISQRKKTIIENREHFQKELEIGAYKEFSKRAKYAIQDGITRKEIENPDLLVKRYSKDDIKKYGVTELTIDQKNTIEKEAAESIEIAKAYQEMQYENTKLMHPYLNPYPLRNVGKNISLIGPFALPATAAIIGLAVNNYLTKMGNALFAGPKKVIENIHLLGMGEKIESSEKMKLIREEDFKYDLYDKTFDVWRSQGLLDWFDATIQEVKKVYAEPHATISAELDRAILVIGESGSGKTTLVNAWLNSLTKEANKSGKVEVDFYQIDPKMFSQEMQVEPGRYQKIDIFSEVKAYLKSIKFANKILVIHIDEAHLLLGTNEGTFSLTRWADLLNFITSVNDEQRKNKSRGAMFIVASTNRPDILPPEIIKNPNRFSNIIEIPIPSYADRIAILKGHLKNVGMQTDHIDFEYLSGLFEGKNQSYGNVLRIIQKAVVFAKINNKMVTTELIYKYINELIRNVTFTTHTLDTYFIDQISSYYGSIAAVALHFEKIQQLFSFDMATIYPLKNDIESKNISELYAYPKPKAMQFGEVFYCKKSYQIEDFNKKTIILALIADLIGKAYCEQIDCGLPKQAQKKVAHAYEKIYEYFAASSLEFAHVAHELKESKQTDLTLTKKTTDLLKKIEFEIKKFLSQQDVKTLIEKTKHLLKEKKMITKKELLEQEEIKHLFEKTEKEFLNLYTAIKNILV
jgi:SpoVK/Ycf46/Vps4 family AAA+-type ATPase